MICEVLLSTKILIGGICERDIDLFILEECVSSPRFLSWLLSHVPGWPDEQRELLIAARSVDQVNGESDLELTLRGAPGCIGKLLIENKLDAGFQPLQLARYRERAAMYVDRGDCTHAAVILLAPTAYVRRSTGEVDAIVSYEDVEAWLLATDFDHRIEYKRELMRAALEKHRLGYNPDTDGPVTDFWSMYWTEARNVAPALQLEKPGPKPAGAGFVWFFPPGLPGDLNLCHKLAKGVVDLHFPDWGRRTGMLREVLGPALESGMEITRAKKSAAVRIRVPVLNAGRPFAEQADAVRKGLITATRLYSWADHNRVRILEIVGDK
jgi:hypothetical protein